MSIAIKINSRSILNIADQTKSFILNILFPPFCVHCNKEGTYICEKCYVFTGESSLICPACDESSFCGERHLRCKTRHGLDGLANAWEYEGVVKKVLSMIKYRGITHAVEELAQSSFQLMIADTARFEPFLKFLLKLDVHELVLTYVPMFLKKEKKRGFNQARLIANQIGMFANKKVVSLLAKTKDTNSQTELDREQRKNNVQNSFEFSGRSNVPESVVLIDDIWTTGATMKECCRVLKKAGVKNVWGFTLAKTP